jgi:hypothetical protein
MKTETVAEPGPESSVSALAACTDIHACSTYMHTCSTNWDLTAAASASNRFDSISMIGMPLRQWRVMGSIGVIG